MSALAWVVVGVGGMLAASAALQMWMRVAAQRDVGKPVPAAGPTLPASGPALVYFFSPTCGPCKAMTPRLEGLAPIAKVDVSRAPELAAEWRVLGTPTTVAVRDGHIVEVLVGVVPRERLAELLA